MLIFHTTHNLLPLASVPGPVSAPQNAPFFWPLQLDVLTPDTLQESRNSGLLTLMHRQVRYISTSLCIIHTDIWAYVKIWVGPDFVSSF